MSQDEINKLKERCEAQREAFVAFLDAVIERYARPGSMAAAQRYNDAERHAMQVFGLKEIACSSAAKNSKS